MSTETPLDRAMRAAVSPNGKVRQRAALQLGTLADATVAQELVDLLVAERDPFVRETLTWVVVENKESTYPHLIDALAGDDPSRAQVLHALSKIQNRDAVEHVLPLVDDPHPQVAAKAWWVLGRMAVPEAAEVLVGRLGQQDEEELRSDLTRALQYLGEPAVPGLAAALVSEDRGVRRHAAEALVAVGAPAIGALDVLLETALGEDRDVAVLAMEAMVPLGSERVDALLEGLRSGDDPWLATVADWFVEERAALAARAERVADRTAGASPVPPVQETE